MPAAPAPMPSPAPAPAPAGGQGGANPIGPVAAVAIVIALIIVGALYFWGKHEWSGDMTGDASATEVDAIADTSSSDALADIEADLDATALDNLDAELNTLDQDY